MTRDAVQSPEPRTSLEDYARRRGRGSGGSAAATGPPLRGKTVVHVNSTREGGGVAEILHKMVPLMQELGLDARWEVISGPPEFYQATKGFHNALQGNGWTSPGACSRSTKIPTGKRRSGFGRCCKRRTWCSSDDPQPAALHRFTPNRKGKWIWRCHIDLGRPYRPVWRFLVPFVEGYDASVFSLAAFARSLPHPQYLIPPASTPCRTRTWTSPPTRLRR